MRVAAEGAGGVGPACKWLRPDWAAQEGTRWAENLEIRPITRSVVFLLLYFTSISYLNFKFISSSNLKFPNQIQIPILHFRSPITIVYNPNPTISTIIIYSPSQYLILTTIYFITNPLSHVIF
jgi:hypothetical protein